MLVNKVVDEISKLDRHTAIFQVLVHLFLERWVGLHHQEMVVHKQVSAANLLKYGLAELQADSLQQLSIGGSG